MHPPSFVLCHKFSYSPGSVQVHSQPKDVKPKMRERKLRSGVIWQGALKRGVKRGFHVLCILYTRGSQRVVHEHHLCGQQNSWYYEKFMKQLTKTTSSSCMGVPRYLLLFAFFFVTHLCLMHCMTLNFNYILMLTVLKFEHYRIFLKFNCQSLAQHTVVT